jgi:2-C-methyl-D-erythritol 2,4-cyclodiphosphate synthase
MSASPRIGSGIDVHAFGVRDGDRDGDRGRDHGRDAQDATIVLGGVTIAAHAPLEGHSDADVVAHATIDALLGAVGLGDIGGRFGVDDPSTAGADSMAMLAEVVQELADAGWRTGNLDVTVVAAHPRIAPHGPAMRARLAEALRIDAGSVAVKATTTDGLGSIGRGEGVAAWAVVLVVPADGGVGSAQAAE